jgi:DNA-binding winged helix-turn-helix (wHTH) protein/tetratricopeptide (TPR) repeat protein
MAPLELALGRFTLHPGRQLLVDDVPVAVGPKALIILSALVEANGGLVTKDELIERIWPGGAVEENTLQSHVSGLRRALGEDGRWIATVPGKGYRYAGPPPNLANPVAASETEDASPDDAPPPPPPRRRRLMIGGALLAVATIGAAAAWQSNVFRSARPVEIERYLILPFDNRTGDPQAEAFGDALSDALAGRIAAQAWDSQVLGHGKAFRYKGQSVDQAKLAQELNLTYLIEGSLPPADTGSDATATIIDERTGAQVGMVSAHAAKGERQELAAGLADQVLSTIFRYEKRLIAAGRENDSDIRNLLIRAETAWGEPSLENRSEAIALIEKALGLDPNNVHALALAGATRLRFVDSFAFSDAAERSHLLAEANIELERAARIEPTRAIIQLLLGDLRSAEGNRETARAQYGRVLALDPSNTHALNRLAREDIHAGQVDAALPRLDLARQFNPDDGYLIDGDFAMIRFMQGRHDEALTAIRRCVAVDAGDPWGWVYLAGLLQMTGRTDEARCRRNAAQARARHHDRQAAPGGHEHEPAVSRDAGKALRSAERSGVVVGCC